MSAAAIARDAGVGRVVRVLPEVAEARVVGPGVPVPAVVAVRAHSDAAQVVVPVDRRLVVLDVVRVAAVRVALLRAAVADPDLRLDPSSGTPAALAVRGRAAIALPDHRVPDPAGVALPFQPLPRALAAWVVLTAAPGVQVVAMPGCTCGDRGGAAAEERADLVPVPQIGAPTVHLDRSATQRVGRSAERAG